MSLRKISNEARAVILGAEDNPFYGVMASDAYIKAAEAMGLPYLRKTMSSAQLRAYIS